MVKKKDKTKKKGVTAAELREREKLRRENELQDQERLKRRTAAEKKIRAKIEEQARKDASVYVQEHILPYSPIKETVDKRVYEILRYKFQRPVTKDPEYIKPKLPKDFYDTETQLKMGEGEREERVRKQDEASAKVERKEMEHEETVQKYGPPIAMNMIGAGQGWQSPFEMLYTAEEKALMGILNVKNPMIRIKPDPGGEVGGVNYDHSDKHRWAQDETWPVAWSTASPECNTPDKLFDGQDLTQWDPTDSVVGQTHWIVIDLRSTMDIDAFRIQSNPSVKNSLRFFRFEYGPTTNGPWEVKDYYEHRNIDAHFGSKETYSAGFTLTARCIRFYVESCGGADLQPKIQMMALRFVAPEVHPMAMPLPTVPETNKRRYEALISTRKRYEENGITAGTEEGVLKLEEAIEEEAELMVADAQEKAEHEAQSMRVMPRIQVKAFEGYEYHGEVRLKIYGQGFSSMPTDNVVEIIPVDRNEPDGHNHKEVWYEARLEPNTHPGDNIKMTSPTAVVHEASRTCLVVSVSNIERKHFGYLAAVVASNGAQYPEKRPLTAVALVVEEFEDIAVWVTDRLKGEDKEKGCKEILTALRLHCFNPEFVWWSLRAIAKGFDTEMDEIGVPTELSQDTMDLVLEVLEKNRKNPGIAAWAMQALVRFTGDEHGNRMSLMQNDSWLELTTAIIQELVMPITEQYRVKEEQEDGTSESVIKTEVFVPPEALELAHYGCAFLCSMALEERVRDYVASLGLQCAMHCMEMCTEDTCVQAVGCQAIFYMVFRCEDAWKQADEFGALAMVDTAADTDRLDETLQKWAKNARTALAPLGWKGRALAMELKLNEAMVHKKEKKENDSNKKKRHDSDSDDEH
jgi:hypothetical protein